VLNSPPPPLSPLLEPESHRPSARGQPFSCGNTYQATEKRPFKKNITQKTKLKYKQILIILEKMKKKLLYKTV
jgi:hypothetical protein